MIFDGGIQAAIRGAEKVLEEVKAKDVIPEVQDVFEFTDEEDPEETHPRINMDVLAGHSKDELVTNAPNVTQDGLTAAAAGPKEALNGTDDDDDAV